MIRSTKYTTSMKKMYISAEKLSSFVAKILFWKHFDFFSPVGKMPLASFASFSYLLRVCNTILWYATYAHFHMLKYLGEPHSIFILLLLRVMNSYFNISLNIFDAILIMDTTKVHCRKIEAKMFMLKYNTS